MSFDFDWFSLNYGKSPDEIRSLDIDCHSKIKLLNVCNDTNTAKENHKILVYGIQRPKKDDKKIDPEYPKLIATSLKQLDALSLKTLKPDISNYSSYSFFLQFTFSLTKPYLSKDDDQFYICENPIRKDRVFKVPMVSASTWKGNLRWTARQIRGLNPGQQDTDKIIVRLFGNEKGEEREFRRGRLNFFPTFFDKIGLEVINPHDRKTKAGTQPIYIESVPEGASGHFSLLYVPFDLLGRPKDMLKRQFKEDIRLVYDSVKDLMLTYGFSAKKNTGYGIIKDDFKEGAVLIRGTRLLNESFINFSELDGKIRNFLESEVMR